MRSLVVSTLISAAALALALARAEGPTPGPSGAGRFAEILGRLKPAFADGDVHVIVSARDDLYLLQSLYRIYLNLGTAARSDGYPVFKALKQDHDLVKELEDAIGAYDESARLGRGAGTELEQVKEILSRRRWIGSKPTLLDGLESRLASTEWPSPARDRDLILERVASQLDQVLDRRYDMHEVEAGIHRLRKEVRWYRYYAKALTIRDTSLLSSTADHCPLEGRAPAPATLSGVGPCLVSQCLVDRTNEVDRQLRDLKRAGADALAAGRDPDAEVTRESAKILERLQRERHLAVLAEQLRACKETK